MSIKKLFATDESRTTVMFACGVVSFLAALAVAWVVSRSWKDIGVLMGPRSMAGFIICSIVGVLLAGSSGIWSLTVVNRLTGRNALKCVLGYLLDASALAIIVAFVIIFHYLKALVVT